MVAGETLLKLGWLTNRPYVTTLVESTSRDVCMKYFLANWREYPFSFLFFMTLNFLFFNFVVVINYSLFLYVVFGVLYTGRGANFLTSVFISLCATFVFQRLRGRV